ncbi:MAG: 30S ribosomal protein S20 [Parcubacteria group bacterium GW2011_GWA2_43_17]|nr:MAG: 30S ribosomal protein S20 [Parcubacteria group bacterium GW2011_GWA2_43_17]KKT92981.1 MAG: 30S ribosomal protein S20 [Parcubacteria group bacterium GW2011_GWF2_45_11]OGY92833.1 MAG: 30S ribosomal protein S20 [Candidatus Komeilibacteria bacterium RIFOXYA2_FULL_45_9]OGY94798.1 MAG: 30S ribosomal protein S20 [Candidatus Komeilibacteria bacterium RIFOXYC2_FULL_45_12]HAH04639.1 30S ribosomal protein S20 [Candidatus Komeilibacteria bacterium]
MPTTKSSKKSLRQSRAHALRNSRRKNLIKDLIKKTNKALLAGEMDKVKTLLPQVQKAVDKAVKVNVLKQNTANRHKSRLAAKVKKAGLK